MRLSGSNSMCQGQLEVRLKDTWHTVDSRSWGQSPDRWKEPEQASEACRKLSCEGALGLGHFPRFSSPQNHLVCYGSLGSFSSCNVSRASQKLPLGLICVGGSRASHTGSFRSGASPGEAAQGLRSRV